LKTGLRKTRKGFLQSLDEVFLGRKELDEQMIVQLEESLVKADIGVKTAYELLDTVTDRVRRKELTDPAAVIARLEELTTEMLTEVEAPLRVGYGTEPFVIMVIGVNGSGKTTTIAKIAARHRAAGRKVLLAAGDTFRAAAVEQLTIWANRIGCDVVRGKEKADPSSVAFEAMEKAIKEDYEVLLVDTAGRLHTRVPLMDELKKVKRTLGKKLSSSPHETLLVIDASMGQNAILQARMFNEAIPITGIALTKLDGTSKGGVVVGISNELKIPIRFIGIGEQMDDLRDFNARAFAAALFTDVEVSEETEEP
jgi:fused signal recognition particle receptor